jgi:hypothetical protein
LEDHEEHNLETCQVREEVLERFGVEMRGEGVEEEKREGRVNVFHQERERIRKNKIFSIQKHINISFS